MKRTIALCLAFMLVFLLIGCTENAVMKENRVYPVGSDIHSLEIRIGAADFTIKEADAFSVESNLKYLSVIEKNGVLSIVDNAKKSVEYKEPVLILYMPTDVMYERIHITTGAGRLTADALSTKYLEFQLGAGDTSISNLIVETEADIEGGVGMITINDGRINDLDLEMGVGELNLTAQMSGDCDLTFGVGESNVVLLGSEDDYTIEIEKGIGSITVDEKVVSRSERFGSGRNFVEIEGGVGAIHLNFKK